MQRKIFTLWIVAVILLATAACVFNGRSNLPNMVDKEITLYGIAKDAKGGAVMVIKNGGVVYIDELTGWNNEFLDKDISATGTLRLKNYIPDPYVDEKGGISQGAVGDEFVLEKAKWELR